MKSIREKLKGKTSKLQKGYSEDLGIRPKQRRTYKKVLFSLEPEDEHFLNQLVANLNTRTRRQTSKSELVRLAIELLRRKNLDEILRSLKQI